MKRIVLLRHGQSTWNKENRFTGWTDVDLTQEGVAEAVRAGELLRDEGFTFGKAYTSYLKRAVKTLDCVLDKLDEAWIPVEKSWRLNEKHYGMLQGLDDYLNEEKVRQIAALGHHPNMEELEVILSRRIRSEKVAIKDIKLRTFIAEGNSRNDLAAHVYDITYGSLVSGVDNLVIIDDSIVRGTTLKQSIIGILDRLGPKKIVIVSSSPQVRYPDYYGIDMAKMSEFIAFKAAIELLKERDMKDVIAAAYRKSKEQVGLPKEQMVNYVKDIDAPFTDEEISAKMVELLTPKGTKAKVEIVYQPLEGLHEACPNHRGDWYFSGNYPTPGGVKMVNQAFINYIEQLYQF